MSASLSMKNAVDYFSKLDTNADGGVSNVELAGTLQALNPIRWSNTRAHKLFNRIDSNSDGCVTEAELLTWISAEGLEQDEFRLTLDSIKHGRCVERKRHGKVDHPVILSFGRGSSCPCSRCSRCYVPASWAAARSGQDFDFPCGSGLKAVRTSRRIEERKDEPASLTMKELALRVSGLPDEWTEHATQLFNNIHQRFPNIPCRAIVDALTRHDFHAGRAISDLQWRRYAGRSSPTSAS